MKKIIKTLFMLILLLSFLNLNAQYIFAIHEGVIHDDTDRTNKYLYTDIDQDWKDSGSSSSVTLFAGSYPQVIIRSPMDFNNTDTVTGAYEDPAWPEGKSVFYDIEPYYINNASAPLNFSQTYAKVTVWDSVAKTLSLGNTGQKQWNGMDFTLLLPYNLFNSYPNYSDFVKQPTNWNPIYQVLEHETYNQNYYGLVRGEGTTVGDDGLVIIASPKALTFSDGASGFIHVEPTDGIDTFFTYVSSANSASTLNTSTDTDFGNANGFDWYVVDMTNDVQGYEGTLYLENIITYTPSMTEPIETKFQGDGGKKLVDYVTYEFDYLPLVSDVTITNLPSVDPSRVAVSIEDNGINVDGKYVGKINYEVDYPDYATTYDISVEATNSNKISYSVLTNDGEAEPTNTTFAYQSLSSNSAPDHEGYVNLNFSYIVSQSVKPQQIVSSDFLIDDRLSNYTVSDFYVSDNGGNDWIGNITFKFVPREADYTFGFMNLTETVPINYESPSDDILVAPTMDEYGQYTKADASNPDDFITGWHIPWKRDIYYANMRGNIQIWFEYSFFREWEEAYFSNLLSNIYITPAIHYEVIKHESYSGGSTVGNLAGRVLLEFRPSQINDEYTISLKRYSDSWLGINDGYRYEYPTKFRIAKLNRENEENPFYWDVQDPSNPDNDYSVELGSGKAGDYIGTTINSSFGAFADVFSAFKSSLGTYTIPALFIIIILFLVPATKNKT